MFEVLREEVVEAHSGLTVHGGGDVGVSVGGLLDGGVPEHLRDQLQLLLVLEHKSSEGVPKIVKANIRQASTLEKRLIGTAVQVVAAHYGAGGGREDKS